MDSLQRLKDLFRELFQLDVADLDFGLYRLFRLKRAEVEAFLNEQLPQEVDRAFAAVTTADRDRLQKLIQERAQQARAFVAPDAILPTGEPNPRYAEIKAVQDYVEACRQLEAVEASEAQRAEVFNLFYTFFSRYYDNGDFIPRRFFGARSAYAVPYNGEEVFFHWANKGQYYVKSGETFRDYAFTVSTIGGEYTVCFKLVEATIPKDNTKGQTRFFFPRPDNAAFDPDARIFVVPFEYRLPTKEEVDKYGQNSKGQEAILDEAEPRIVQAVPDVLLQSALAVPSPNGREAEGEQPPTLLRRRLRHFTKKRTTDYFVHKNLAAFLRQELEFFIRDQVVHELDGEGDFAAKRRVLKVFRKLASTVIAFLAEIEDAQKRLFEKKKFVLRTDYLVPIQRLPRELWAEVLANPAQIAEWRELFSLEPEASLFNGHGEFNEHVLEQHPTLVVDTRHFPAEFTRRLLAAIEDLDECTDGVLIHGENFQALSLLQARYREQVKCVYIDPPYNRNGDDFPYKDRYRHSSWLAMMQDRLEAARSLLRPEGVLFSSIDENERTHLNLLLDVVFGQENRIEELVWAQNTTHSQSPLYSTNHEYVAVYARDRQAVEGSPQMLREAKPGYDEVMELIKRLNPDYPSIAEIERAIADLYEQHRREFEAELREMGLEPNEETRKLDPWRGLYNYCHAEYRDALGRYVPEAEARTRQAVIWVWREDNPSAPAQKQAEGTRDPEDPNYRFYRPLHPRTGKPCPHPKTGWRWPYEWPDNGRDSFVKLAAENRIVWGEDETKVPQFKRFLHEVETNVAKSFFHDYTDGEKQLAALFGQAALYPTPKPTTLVRRFVEHSGDPGGIVLDFFAGSGTTGHAVIDLNRQDGGRRKFILVEMADYFDTVLVPRIKKVMFAPEWRDGKPKRLPTPAEAERTPRLVKILRLESYEDALHNTFSDQVIARLAEPEKAYREVVGDEAYRIRYLMKLPLEASDSMLNLAKLEHPFDYRLEILTDHGPRTETVDLVETFNWLYGLRVHRQLTWVNPEDQTGKEEGGRRYRAVVASDREGKKRILVVWRDMTGLDPAMERLFLEAKAAELGPFDEQWINGDAAAKGFASLDGLFKRLMEESAR